MNFGNLVAVLAVAAAVPLILAAVPRVRVPGPVLEIVAGLDRSHPLLQATSPPFIVAATTIGLQVHAISPADAAALVAAGLFSVILFPAISLQLLRSSAGVKKDGSDGAGCGDGKDDPQAPGRAEALGRS